MLTELHTHIWTLVQRRSGVEPLPLVKAWRRHTHDCSESGGQCWVTQKTRNSRAGVILPGRQGGIKPPQTFELSLEYCLGFCQVETWTKGFQEGLERCSRQMEQLEQRCIHRHTLYRHTHVRSDASFSQELGNCLKDVRLSTWVSPQPKVPPGSGFQVAFPPEGIEHLLSMAFLPFLLPLCHQARRSPLGRTLRTVEDSGTNLWRPSRSWVRGSWSWRSLVVTRCRLFHLPLPGPLATWLSRGGRESLHSAVDCWGRVALCF